MPIKELKSSCVASLIAGAFTAASVPALASSHREAPFVAQNPTIDATDLYLFRSYEPGRSAFVTMVADYIPLQDPPGGPMFFSMNENALYEIHVDNVGDGKEHLTFQFRFKNEFKDIALPVGGQSVSIPVLNGGPIDTVNSPNAQRRETYTVTVVRGDRRHDYQAGQMVTKASGGARYSTSRSTI